MSLFGKRTLNVAVVDIHSSSVGAAYVVLSTGKAPEMVHQVRIPLLPNATEPVAEAFPRTLATALEDLVRDGAPKLRTQTGRGSIDRVLVAFAAPWQESTVGNRLIERDKPFTFTREALNEADGSGRVKKEGQRPVSEMVIATLLNGYEVAQPFGKKVERAELITLSATLDEAMQDLVEKAIRKALHQRHIEWNAFMPETYAVFRDLYPHQRDFLVLDIGGEASDMLLVKHGLLVSTASMAHGVGEVTRSARAAGVSTAAAPELSGPPLLDLTRNSSFETKMVRAKTTWLSEARAWLDSVARQEPLPRTIFLLADENVRDFLRNLLDAQELRSLWLSDEALAILPVLPTQFIPFVSGAGDEPVDPALALLALAAGKRFAL